MRKTFTRIFSNLVLLITFFVLVQSFIIIKFAIHTVKQIVSNELEESADQLCMLLEIHEHMSQFSIEKLGDGILLRQYYPQVQSIKFYDNRGVLKHTMGKEIPEEDEKLLRRRFTIPYKTVEKDNGEIFHFELLPYPRPLQLERPKHKWINSYIRYNIFMILLSIPLAMAFAFIFSSKLAEDSKKISAALIRLAHGERDVDIPRGLTSESQEIASVACQLQKQIIEKEKRQIRRVQELTHDLKSPLAGLYTQLESVEMGVLELSEERFSHLYGELGFLNSLIDNMAEVYRLVDDNVYYSPQEIRSTQLVNTLIDRFRPIAEEAGKILITDIKASVFTADFNLLLRAVGNLISNAVHHGRGEEILLKIYMENDKVIIDLINDGHIPEDELPHVLTRYWSKGHNGSGLGLPIAVLIARKHNGELKVQNLEEDHVLFSLSIPQNQ